MINWYLGDEDMAALLAELKAAMPALNEQSQKLLNFLFFRTDKKGEPDYDWDVVVANFRRNKKDVVCTVDDDVLPPALYPAFDLMMGAAEGSRRYRTQSRRLSLHNPLHPSAHPLA